MPSDYAYDHGWTQERLRLAGLEAALDPGTREHLLRLGARPGSRCLEVGAGGGSIATWLVEQVSPHGVVVATDLETDFLDTEASRCNGLQVLRHDICTEDLPAGFDLVHARWLVEWLPDKRAALQRMARALRPGGALLVEEPDFVTIFGAAEPPALRRVTIAAMRHLESTCPVNVEYGRQLLDDLSAAGLDNVAAEGRCLLTRGGTPPAGHFLRFTLEKLRAALLADESVSESDFAQAIDALRDPAVTVMMPMTIAAWGWRPPANTADGVGA
jgi:SAM-dependent methyltransferase